MGRKKAGEGSEEEWGGIGRKKAGEGSEEEGGGDRTKKGLGGKLRSIPTREPVHRLVQQLKQRMFIRYMQTIAL